MLKRWLVFCLSMVWAVALFPSFAFAAGDEAKIDGSAAGTGKVTVSYNNGTAKKGKLFVEKGQTKYTYNLKNDGTAESFPLQMGDGEYRISILENIQDNSYRYVKTQSIQVALASPNAVYLNSVQNIRWNRKNKAIRKDLELIAKEKSADKKLNIIYDFLVKKFTYDYDKLKNLSPDYLPDIDTTLNVKKGICYDYSSLFAAMKRSEGVPTKLVKGYSTKVDGYHAWNEILIRGKWVIIDTTYDSSMYKAKVKYTMVKNSKDYKKVYEY